LVRFPFVGGSIAWVVPDVANLDESVVVERTRWIPVVLGGGATVIAGGIDGKVIAWWRNDLPFFVSNNTRVVEEEPREERIWLERMLAAVWK
jgi:hypothetical protein